MRLLLKFIIIQIINICINASQMGGSDVVMNYSNAKQMTEMTLKFEIVNGLIETDYIKFILPFPLHTALMMDANAPTGYSRPYGLIAKWISFNTPNDVPKMVQLFCQTGESSTYYAQFLKGLQQVSALVPGWYQIVFKINDPTALNTQKETQLLQIQTFTVSSIDANAVVYDSNQAHSFLYLDKQPLDSLGISVSFDNETTRKSLSLLQTVYFDLTISNDIIDTRDNKKLIIKISDKSFQLKGVCQSAAKTTLPIINNLLADDYICNVDENNNQIVLILKTTALLKQQTYRISGTVQNPSYVMEGVSVQVKCLREQSTTIIQTGEQLNAFATDSLSIQSHTLNLAWGIYDQPSLPINLYVVRSSPPADPGYMPYNQINLKFKLKQNTPPSVEQRIIIQLNTDITSQLLTGSIIHNLPSATNRDVTCREFDATNPTARRLVCSQIGVLDSTVDYFLSFKMYFEYEVYEAWISCEQFGTIQIQSMVPVTSKDNIFAISRDIKFINQMREQNSATVVNVDNNSVFLEKLKSFNDIVIIVNAQDFSDYPYEVYATSRPSSFAGKFTSFQDYFVPASNVLFINYLQSNYPNIYIAQFPQTDTYTVYDITKSGNKYFTMQKTVPQNIKTLLTKNGLNWKQTGSDIIASSYKTKTANGFQYNSDALFDFKLEILMKGKYKDVTTNTYNGSGNPALTNNVGVLFMMNPLIKFSSPTVTSAAAVSILNPGSADQYTSLQVEFSTQNNLASYFPDTAADKSLVINNVNLQRFSNDKLGYEANLDIYIQTIDGIIGAQNAQSRNAYILVNGYALSTLDLPNLNLGLVNYYSTATEGNDGKYIPSLLRVIGTLDSPSKKIVIFFDNLEPLYFNQSQDLLSCTSSIDSTNQSQCKVYISPQPNINSYFQMSRIEITFASDISSNLSILIPIKVPKNINTINLLLGTINKNSAIISVKPVKQATFVLPSTALTDNLTGGTSSPSYGIKCDLTCKAGQEVSTLQLNGGHTGGSVAQNSGTDFGAGFTFVTDYPFFKDTSVIQVVPTEYGGDAKKCAFFIYRYSGSSRYGIFCPLEGAIPTGAITITNGKLPQSSKLIGQGGYSTKTGLLTTLLKNTVDTISSADIDAPSIVLPTIDAKQKTSAISFAFTTPTDLPSSFIIKLQNSANLQLASREANQICRSQIDKTISVCEVQDPTSLKSLSFKITIKGGQVLKNNVITIILYGITTADTGSDVTTAELKVFDSTDTFVYSQITSQTIKFNPEVASTPDKPGVYPTKFDVQGFTQSNLNKNSLTNIYFDLLLSSKYIFEDERVQVTFDQFSSSNSGNLSNLSCLISYTDPDKTKPPVIGPKPLSNDIKTTTFKMISNKLVLNIIFKAIGYQKERIYSVSCYNFIVPAAASTAIEFKYFALQTLTPSVVENELLPSVAAISTTAPIAPMKSSAVISKVTKQFGSPGSATELIFEIYTVESAIDEYSRVLVYFPNYYPILLSRDGDNLSCLQNDSLVISCNVVNLKTLEIKYFKQSVSKGGLLKFTVSGVIQPLNYSVGKFLVVLDNDYNNDQFIESISLKDDAVRQDQTFLKGSLLVLNASISSIYLLQDQVNYSFWIQLDSKMDSINYGQYIIVNFPQIFAKQLKSYTKPDCSITKENSPQKEYSGACQTLGLRIKILVNELMTSGSAYIITINNIYNPPIFGPQAYKWIIEIGDQNQEFVLYRSFASTSNYADQTFMKSPDQQLLNFMDIDGNTIESLSLIKGVISDPVYIQRQSDPVFARSFTLSSITDEIYTYPLTPNVIVGTQSKSIQFKSDNAIGLYEVQLQKTGDGNFYANLPTLRMVISFKEQPLKVEITSNNIFLTLATLLPIDYIDITFTVDDSSVFKGLVLDATKSSLRFTSTQRSAILPFTLSSTPTVSAKVTFKIVISGPNAASYALPLQLIDAEFIAQDATPLLVSVTPTVSIDNPSNAKITGGCGKSAMFYWGISLKYDGDVTKCVLTSDLLLNPVQDSKNDIQLCFYQYGQVYIQSGKTQDIKLRDLRINSNYQIFGLCIDGNNQNSFTTPAVQMKTTDNAGKTMKMKIDFKVPPSREQKQKVVCFLTLFFSVQPKNVKTFDSTYCQEMYEQRRRRVLLAGQNSLDCAEETVPIPTVNVAGMYGETFYFAKNLDVDKDELSAKIISATKKKCFKDYINTYVIGIPNVINIYLAEEVSLVAPTQVSSPLVYSGENWGYFHLESLKTNSLIYMILDVSGTATPSAPQIIKGYNSLNKVALASVGIAYDKQTSISANYTFYPLSPGQSYTLYYVLGNECPFPDQLVLSNVYSASLTAQKTPVETYSSLQAFSFIIYIALFITILG